MHPTPAPTPSARLDALDAVRALAMLLGVVLHACVAYMHIPMHNLIWPIQEPGASRIPDAIFWFLHGFRVPLFFVVSGFLAALAVERKGPAGFIDSRLRRVGAPFLAACFIILPIVYIIWGWGWVERGFANWHLVWAMHFGPDVQRNFRGPSHLWFLEYLFLYSLAVWVVARTCVRITARAAIVVIPFCIAVSIAVLAWRPAMYLDFRNGFTPRVAPGLYFAAYFTAGLALYPLSRAGERFRAWSRAWIPASLLGAAAGISSIWLLMHWTQRTDHGWRQGMAPDTRSAINLALLVAAFAWLWSAAWILGAAACVRRLGTVGVFLRDASYWVYLTHLPWVGLLVMLLHPLDWSPEFKTVLVALGAMAIALVSFLPVRRTKLGRILGVRPAPTPP